MSAEQDKKIAFYLSKIEDLPSLPAIVLELTRLIDDPMSSTNEIEELMSKDPGLTLKVLKLANSAYYSIPGGAKTLLRAITYLGFNSVKQLALTSTLFKMLDTKSGRHFNIQEFWKHSVGTGAIAELLARRFKMALPEDAFVCGLVHDMGKIVLRMVDEEEFDKTCEFAKLKGMSVDEAERERGTPRHTQWGQVLAKKWRLPTVIQCAVRDHHTERIGLRTSAAPDVNMMVDAVFIANKLVHRFNFGDSGYTVNFPIEASVMERCGLSEADLRALEAPIEKALQAVESLLEALHD